MDGLIRFLISPYGTPYRFCPDGFLLDVNNVNTPGKVPAHCVTTSRGFTADDLARFELRARMRYDEAGAYGFHNKE